jgi:hypothetical protein
MNMPRMLDLIRNSEVPSTLMQSAARGSLSVAPDEMIEILVHLALHSKIFGEQAQMTLAGWDEHASLAAAGDPKTSSEVLDYFVSRVNLRPSLLPALAENPSISEEALDELAVSGSRSTVEVLLTSARVLNSARLLQGLQSNPALRPNELSEIANRLAGVEARAATAATETDPADELVEGAVAKYLEENAAELEIEKTKPFLPIGIAPEGISHERRAYPDVSEATPIVAQPPAATVAIAGTAGKSATDIAADVSGKSATAPVAGKPTAAAAVHAKKHPAPIHEERRDSTLQKISKLDIRGRITLAMRGSKEDRSILVRDSTKLVAIAVLESPKVSEGEVEAFALQKNVLQAVLRAIPLKRKFAKNYNIMRNLVQNPRTPLDLSLGLMKNLLVHDLKNLSGNKEVPDTIRKLALRMYKQKVEKKS